MWSASVCSWPTSLWLRHRLVNRSAFPPTEMVFSDNDVWFLEPTADWKHNRHVTNTEVEELSIRRPNATNKAAGKQDNKCVKVISQEAMISFMYRKNINMKEAEQDGVVAAIGLWCWWRWISTPFKFFLYKKIRVLHIATESACELWKTKWKLIVARKEHNVCS